jgi:hypothetical protein
MGADNPEIAIGVVEGGLYVGLQARATQRTCPTADKVVNDFLASRPEIPAITLDLTGCDWLDSTFAGWLVSLSKRISRYPNGQVVLAGCGKRCLASLEKMKLTDFCRFAELHVPEETQMVRCTTSDQPKKEELKLMLEAHEALAGISPENAQIFAPIAATLRSQIERR